MKRIYCTLFTAAVIAISCTKNNATPDTILNEHIDSLVSTAKYSGNFSNGPYGSVTGTAKIYLKAGMYTLALENIAISNGPDLHVYLSKEIEPINFIDLGKLKSTNGNQLYEIKSAPDFSSYKYALIHCQQYNHLFGSAELK